MLLRLDVLPSEPLHTDLLVLNALPAKVLEALLQVLYALPRLHQIAAVNAELPEALFNYLPPVVVCLLFETPNAVVRNILCGPVSNVGSYLLRQYRFA